MIRRFLLIALSGLCLPALAFAQTFGAEEFTLKNGMQVVVIPNHRAPVVTHMVWLKVGGADNASGRSGMAHYLEHLLFKGTKKLAPGEFSKTIKTLGGNDNAFTGQDYTAFHESVSVANLGKVMAMDADRLSHLSVPDAHFQSEKAVVLEERRQRTDNEPKAIFGEQISAALYVNHPYGTPVIGWLDEIERYEWPDVKAYYDTWYAPNNAILVVSGDITAAQLKPLAEKYYGALPAKKLPKRLRPNVPPAIGETLMTLRDETIRQPVYQRIYIAPTEAKNRKDSLALQVLAEILDGGPSTRLYRHLVVEKKQAINVSFSYNATALDYGTIWLAATPADNVTPETIGAALLNEVQAVLDQGVTETEVSEAVRRLQDEAIFARDSLSGPAMIFGAALSTGSSVADIESWPADIAKITAADVQAAAKTYLDAAEPWIRKPVTGYLLPAATPPEKPAVEKQLDKKVDQQKEQADVQR